MDSRLPSRPTPPPGRVIHYGLFGFVGNEDEFRIWKSEPWWRKALGITTVDKLRKQAGK